MEPARDEYSGWRSWMGYRRVDMAIEVERRYSMLGDEMAVSQFDSNFHGLRRVRLFYSF
jgi:hypothetical protein